MEVFRSTDRRINRTFLSVRTVFICMPKYFLSVLRGVSMEYFQQCGQCLSACQYTIFISAVYQWNIFISAESVHLRVNILHIVVVSAERCINGLFSTVRRVFIFVSV